jgi:hypothetical protein
MFKRTDSKLGRLNLAVNHAGRNPFWHFDLAGFASIGDILADLGRQMAPFIPPHL